MKMHLIPSDPFRAVGESLDSSADHPAVRHWNLMSDLEQHKMQGYFPFRPDCLECSQSKGVKQRRRAGVMKEIVAALLLSCLSKV